MLPDWLRDKLANPPAAGAGIHAYLFSCARQLHPHMPPAAVAAALTSSTAGCARRVTAREIRDAVNNSLAVAWERKGGPSAVPTVQKMTLSNTEGHSADAWPKPDVLAREQAIIEAVASGVPSLYDLWERSPARNEWTADDWLDWLFPEAEWLCLAVDHPATARSRKREKWTFGPADECGLVVPSPMTGPSGKGLDGRTSHRCLDNTGARRWLVVEFDKIAIDEQAALHWHFRALEMGWPPLRLVVHSGGKSLHGWYGPIEGEEIALEFMTYAVLLGADPATWNRCQLVRLPGGRRKAVTGIPVSIPEWAEPEEFTRLEVLYFNPPGSSQHLLSSACTARAVEDEPSLGRA